MVERSASPSLCPNPVAPHKAQIVPSRGLRDASGYRSTGRPRHLRTARRRVLSTRRFTAQGRAPERHRPPPCTDFRHSPAAARSQLIRPSNQQRVMQPSPAAEGFFLSGRRGRRGRLREVTIGWAGSVRRGACPQNTVRTRQGRGVCGNPTEGASAGQERRPVGGWDWYQAGIRLRPRTGQRKGRSAIPLRELRFPALKRWSGYRESNPGIQLGRLLLYH